MGFRRCKRGHKKRRIIKDPIGDIMVQGSKDIHVEKEETEQKEEENVIEDLKVSEIDNASKLKSDHSISGKEVKGLSTFFSDKSIRLEPEDQGGARAESSEQPSEHIKTPQQRDIFTPPPQNRSKLDNDL